MREPYCLTCGRHHEPRKYARDIPPDDPRRQWYARGEYVFPPAPVTTLGWNTEAWIRWIDVHGCWTPKATPKE